MFIYGNVPCDDKDLMNESNETPMYSMGKSVKDVYVNMSTYGGLYKLLIDYSCHLNEQLSIGHLSNQKVKILMGSVLDMSNESMDRLIVLSGAHATPYTFDYDINGLPFTAEVAFSVFAGQVVRLSLSHVESSCNREFDEFNYFNSYGFNRNFHGFDLFSYLGGSVVGSDEYNLFRFMFLNGVIGSTMPKDQYPITEIKETFFDSMGAKLREIGGQ